VTVVGASGCGKSTLLRIVGGLERQSSGEVRVDGVPADGPGVDRAMVFQHYSLYPWLTVMENIKFSRRLKAQREGITSSDVEAASGRADALLSVMVWNPRPTLIRISSPGACSSGRPSPGRSCRARRYCSWTSLSVRSTRRPARSCTT